MRTLLPWTLLGSLALVAPACSSNNGTPIVDDTDATADDAAPDATPDATPDAPPPDDATGDDAGDESTSEAATPDDAAPGDASPDDATSDASTADATTGDATTADAATGDATASDARPDATAGDAGSSDASTMDAAAGDAAPGDAAAGDAATSDAATGDAGASCAPVVNEIQVAGSGGSADEFVELYNPCATTVNLMGFHLVYRSGSNMNPASGSDSTTLASFTTETLASHAFMLFAGMGYTGTATVDGRFGSTSGALAAASGAVALRNASGAIVDSVAYGPVSSMNAFIEGTAAMSPPSGQSIARMPDGHDTNNNLSDLPIDTTPTPHGPNT